MCVSCEMVLVVCVDLYEFSLVRSPPAAAGIVVLEKRIAVCLFTCSRRVEVFPSAAGVFLFCRKEFLFCM